PCVTGDNVRNKGNNNRNNAVVESRRGEESRMARGGRRDQPIDRSAGPLAEFVDDLRRLRGETSLEEVGRRIGYHPSTVSRRLKPVELPPWRFVESYVRACGADPAGWRPRWEALAAAGPTAPAVNGAAHDGAVAASGQGGAA